MNLGLQDRVVLVTGGAQGIGAATVRAFAEEGAKVVLVDRQVEAAAALAKERPAIHLIVGDLTEESLCTRAVNETVERFGQLDVLVNNAGVNDSVGLEASPAQFMASLRLNLLPAYTLTHLARPHLIARRGAVINLSSKVASTGQGRTSGYAAAKGALNALTREWALALGAHGVRVNCVVPAECDSDQYRRWFASQPDPEVARARVAALVPFERRLTRPEEVADAIVWLASSRASHLTGQFLFVDGGYTHLDRAATSAHQW
ncbi:MAG TPA: SDR family oxidoreductase [Verrucomicrobiota bacterium]|nr:short chain dehydrogenase [Verrucomicrobiales bacterium]HRI12212.1 SDR family oxidoreductase [Verrucomicrobiota bacterium]